MKFCQHANCSSMTLAKLNGLCKYHQGEFDNNGKEGHWTCTWCTEFKKKGGKVNE